MSRIFEITPCEETFFKGIVSVKSKDEKWKDFPACTLPNDFIESLENLKSLTIYEDDVILCGFPRSGTTLMQEMIWLLVNDFNFEKAKSVITDRRFPLLESFEMIQKFYDGKVSKTHDDLERPRTLKTHLPVQLLPDEIIWEKKPKIIHMSRDVKDVVISSYHYSKNMMHLEIGLENFLQNFLDDKMVFTPYREHCINYLRISNYSNIMYLTYEWVIENIEDTIKRVATFLEKKVSDENMKKLMEHLKFDSMKSEFFKKYR